MKKIIVRIMIATLCFSAMLANTSALAADSETVQNTNIPSASATPSAAPQGFFDEVRYSNYNVSGTTGKDTAGLANDTYTDDPYFWVWAAPPSGRAYVVHRSILHNSNHAVRSDTLLTYEGTTNQAATTADAFYVYHMYLLRHFDADGFLTLSGTWGYIYP